MSLLLGLAVLALLWFLLKAYAGADLNKLMPLARKVGAGLVFVAAAFLLLRGRIDMALALGWIGLWLLGYGAFGLPGLARRTAKTSGATSRVRSATIDMELDHDTGALRGHVFGGAYQGADLDGLDRDRLLALLRECLASDVDGARLLEAYLDRRFPGWRKDADADHDAGAGQARAGPMTEEEAYQVLGLAPGASDQDIRRAHRSLMKKLHPDQGGSTYLAARVNQAKDILLARHR